MRQTRAARAAVMRHAPPRRRRRRPRAGSRAAATQHKRAGVSASTTPRRVSAPLTAPRSARARHRHAPVFFTTALTCRAGRAGRARQAARAGAVSWRVQTRPDGEGGPCVTSRAAAAAHLAEAALSDDALHVKVLLVDRSVAGHRPDAGGAATHGARCYASEALWTWRSDGSNARGGAGATSPPRGRYLAFTPSMAAGGWAGLTRAGRSGALRSI
jgi:hypothetical protein